MHVVVGIASLALVVLVLVEFFIVYLVPRRVKRDPRLARQLYVALWRPWRAVADRLNPRTADTFLGLFGPFGLILLVTTWTIGLIFGFAGLQWAAGSHLRAGSPVGFGDDLYFSAASFFSASTTLSPMRPLGQVLRVAEAASALSVLFIVIGYLPLLYQAHSRREVAVSQLDARAASPPSTELLLVSAAASGGWETLDDYLKDWEVWTAELMETHLAYPVLAYFRSQHVNQNWLAALVTVVDACAFSLAESPEGAGDGASVTYAIGRHALADLSHAFGATPIAAARDRLDAEDLAALREAVAEAGLELGDPESAAERLRELREAYEPYAVALAERLALALPSWRAPHEPQQNWRRTMWRLPPGKALP